MREILILLLLALLTHATGCAANFSGLPAPATPVGTGLPRLDRPWAPRSEPLPPSPNRRVLPVTREPGLWAADGAPRASADHIAIAEIDIPTFFGGTRAGAKDVAQLCADTMESAILHGKVLPQIRLTPHHVTKCLAARLYLACAEGFAKGYAAGKGSGKPYDEQRALDIGAVVGAATHFKAVACSGASDLKDSDDLAKRVTDLWWHVVRELYEI